jgi:hypothetical protein
MGAFTRGAKGQVSAVEKGVVGDGFCHRDSVDFRASFIQALSIVYRLPCERLRKH